MALVSVQPIAAGYAYGLRLTFAGGAPLFPSGCALRAEVRDYAGAPQLAGVLTSDSGTVSVIDSETVELFLSPALTGALSRQTCAVDLVRTDAAPAIWLGVQLVLPVVTTVTRSTADGLNPGRIVSGLIGSVLATVIAPLGILVTLGAALGTPPWSTPQVVTTAPLTGRGAVPTPGLTATPASGLITAQLGPTSVVPAPAVEGQSTVKPPALAGTALIPPPGVGLQPAQTLGILPPPPPATVATPAIAFDAAKLIGGAGVPMTTMVGSPLLAPDGTVVLGPAAITSATVTFKPSAALQDPQSITTGTVPAASLPAPAVSQPSTSSYAADGYVADGYVGAS